MLSRHFRRIVSRISIRTTIITLIIADVRKADTRYRTSFAVPFFPVCGYGVHPKKPATSGGGWNRVKRSICASFRAETSSAGSFTPALALVRREATKIFRGANKNVWLLFLLAAICRNREWIPPLPAGPPTNLLI